jgi:hypothetical protein
MILKNLFIVFVGNPVQGKLLERDVETYGWRVSVASTVKMALAEYVFFMPDLVILDEFPESNLARSVCFHLRSIHARPILGLSKSSIALKFNHLNSLSVINILDRNPKQKDFVKTISGLVHLNRKSSFRQRDIHRNDEGVHSSEQKWKCSDCDSIQCISNFPSLTKSGPQENHSE